MCIRDSLKCCCYETEPVLWQGGLLHPVYKGSGDPAECPEHRAVVLEDAPTKIAHRIGHTLAFNFYDLYVPNTQFGGV
eukprot:12212477-Alexandrium_andersonii.AAC.1